MLHTPPSYLVPRLTDRQLILQLADQVADTSMPEVTGSHAKRLIDKARSFAQATAGNIRNLATLLPE